MKNKLIIFCLETSKGQNKKDQKSDELYIKKLMSVYFPDIENEYKIKYTHLGGKHNFNSSKIKSQINEEIKAFQSTTNDGIYNVLYVLDKDEFNKNIIDKVYIQNVQEYIESSKEICEVIWFTKDIEHVLLGKRTNKNKTSKARNYKVENVDELKKQLSCINPCSDKTSNFIITISKIIN